MPSSSSSLSERDTEQSPVSHPPACPGPASAHLHHHHPKSRPSAHSQPLFLCSWVTEYWLPDQPLQSPLPESRSSGESTEGTGSCPALSSPNPPRPFGAAVRGAHTPQGTQEQPSPASGSCRTQTVPRAGRAQQRGSLPDSPRPS